MRPLKDGEGNKITKEEALALLAKTSKGDETDPDRWMGLNSDERGKLAALKALLATLL